MKKRVGLSGKRPECAPKRARPWATGMASDGFEGSEGAEGTSKRIVMVLPGLRKRKGMGTSWRYP